MTIDEALNIADSGDRTTDDPLYRLAMAVRHLREDKARLDEIEKRGLQVWVSSFGMFGCGPNNRFTWRTTVREAIDEALKP